MKKREWKRRAKAAEARVRELERRERLTPEQRAAEDEQAQILAETLETMRERAYAPIAPGPRKFLPVHSEPPAAERRPPILQRVRDVLRALPKCD